MRIAIISSIALVGLALVVTQTVRSLTREVSSTENQSTAEQILLRMVDAYRHAKSYSDRGVIRISEASENQTLYDSAPFTVRFNRSGCLWLRAYQVHLVSDGDRLRAKFMDKEIPELSRQIVDRVAPDKMELSVLKRDAFLWDHLEGGIGGLPVSLRLLLEDNALSEVFTDDVQLKRLPSQKIGDKQCHLIQAGADGTNTVVFWIDVRTHILRRFEYPQMDGFSTVADFNDARFHGSSNRQDYRLSLLPDDRPVQYFVVPPQPLTTHLLGKTVNRFEFVALNGDLISAADLRNRTTVLVWFNRHPASQAALAAVQRVYDWYQDNDQVQFYAVWAEGSSLESDQLLGILDEWKIDLPVVRDLEAFGRDVFQITGAPTLVGLDTENRVQLFEVGVREDLETFLSHGLKQLSNGVDIAAILVQQHDEESRQYRHNLMVANTGNEEILHQVPQPDIRPRSEPRHWKLTPLWSLTQLESPGNITVLEKNHQISFAVNDGLRKVVELDIDGSIRQSIELNLPRDAEVTYLQQASDAEGRRWVVGGASLARKVFLFDEAWQPVLQYPAENQSHDGIQDVQLLDLNGDGTLEMYVGFWGLAGIHAVDIHGERTWRNQAVHSVLSLVATRPDVAGLRQLLVVSADGGIVPVTFDGREGGEFRVGSHAIYHLQRAVVSQDGKPTFCGLAFTDEETHLALGINEDWQETWSYRLPSGIHQTAVRRLSSARLFEETYWLFPGSDGSVHIVSEDGKFYDVFQQGAAIRGLVATQAGDDALLIVASEQEVVGYKVDMNR